MGDVPPHYFRRLEENEIRIGDRPLEMDLGCGDGSFLINLAKEHPERDFIGVERLLGRCKKVAKRIARASSSWTSCGTSSQARPASLRSGRRRQGS